MEREDVITCDWTRGKINWNELHTKRTNERKSYVVLLLLLRFFLYVHPFTCFGWSFRLITKMKKQMLVNKKKKLCVFHILNEMFNYLVAFTQPKNTERMNSFKYFFFAVHSVIFVSSAFFSSSINCSNWIRFVLDTELLSLSLALERGREKKVWMTNLIWIFVAFLFQLMKLNSELHNDCAKSKDKQLKMANGLIGDEEPIM